MKVIGYEKTQLDKKYPEYHNLMQDTEMYLLLILTDKKYGAKP